MLDVGNLELVKELEWIILIIVYGKKTTGEVRIYVNLRNMNDACLHVRFPTLFTDEVLESVGGEIFCSFTDGFSG